MYLATRHDECAQHSVTYTYHDCNSIQNNYYIELAKHPNKGHTLNKGQRPMYQSVCYSESPLYKKNCIIKTISKDGRIKKCTLTNKNGRDNKQDASLHAFL